MSEAICGRESVYGADLTRGRKYEILELDEAKGQVKVRGNRGRMRWYPLSCFDFDVPAAAVLSTVEVQSEYEADPSQYVEVIVGLSDGQRRWCIFATPAALIEMGDPLKGTTVRVLYGAPHLIVATAIDEEIIHRTLHHIDSQGELLACTLPLGVKG
ncbi:hypothetical protein [Gloeobacter kilaueensis]|uniref:Uncharacterized protein n=1 Tax=Gloeobacter kilaueensis (strain ATCC BAA-2537 / CCAP 1431/1 / ULC 316 / JS1) TaxID=1183438 RepID=U5QQ35_GLOK1|nr:hypothetical protein [Gloeobacter kilaueensis]AGY59749.1 hypothetical protein GKIL_3503 [Gloeobacter kilaueensis JS1]